MAFDIEAKLSSFEQFKTGMDNIPYDSPRFAVGLGLASMLRMVELPTAYR